jgi:lipopolysaccharide cholinephosphotransferase
MKELMRKDTPDEWGLKKLQNVILNIAYDLDVFCQENTIPYCLMGGSALGAKRHGGFIPWDDDLDVFMTPDAYERFRSVFNEKGNKEKYYIQEQGASNGKVITAKVRLNNSYLEEEILKGWHIHHGIYIDIFILHTCPNNKLLRIWQYVWAKYLIVKGLANKEYHRHGAATYYLLKAMKILPKRFLLDFGLNQVYAFRNKHTDYFCNYLGKARLKKGTYKHAHFATTKRVPFETIELNAAIGLEDFLKERFGDYMKIPSLDRIKYEQHASTWGIGEQYQYPDKSDEKYMF